MKSLSSLLALVTLALASGPRLAAAETAPPAAAAAPEFTDEQKVQLRAVDQDIERFEALLAQDDDAKHAAEVREQIDAFKVRRDAMRKVAFDSGKYDELRFELNSEYQRLALWLAPLRTPPRSTAKR
jgi:hypothetical protein